MAHVAFRPMSKSNEMIGGLLICHIPSMSKAKDVIGSSCQIHSMSKAKVMMWGSCHIQFNEKTKETMGGSCHIPSHEQSNRDE
jgi:hypothetical protein